MSDIDLSELEGPAKEIGKTILDKTKEALEGQWDALDDEDKDQLKRATIELAKLEAKARLGQEVDPERVQVLKATIGNWRMVGSISTRAVQRAFLDALKEAGKVAGGFLGSFATSALKGLIPGI